jgi:hypothetical protein
MSPHQLHHADESTPTAPRWQIPQAVEFDTPAEATDFVQWMCTAAESQLPLDIPPGMLASAKVWAYSGDLNTSTSSLGAAIQRPGERGYNTTKFDFMLRLTKSEGMEALQILMWEAGNKRAGLLPPSFGGPLGFVYLTPSNQASMQVSTFGSSESSESVG